VIVRRIDEGDVGVVSRLADAFAAEWPEWAATISRGELEATFHSGHEPALPVVFAAIDAGAPVGTVALRPYFDAAPMEQTPWVRGLWVERSRRGRGIDRLLMRVLEDEARRRGFRRIYAATNRIERLGARWGWKVFQRVEHRGEPMAWLLRDLTPR
jgi:GNAT superfamily N-acetyltransferase